MTEKRKKRIMEFSQVGFDSLEKMYVIIIKKKLYACYTKFYLETLTYGSDDNLVAININKSGV